MQLIFFFAVVVFSMASEFLFIDQIPLQVTILVWTKNNFYMLHFSPLYFSLCIVS